MKSILGSIACVLVHLSLSNGILGPTSHIEMGVSENAPTIYNKTIEIQPPSDPWYRRMFGFSKPPHNATYTFPPFPNCEIKSFMARDVEPYGHGGLAEKVAGGPQHSNVTIKFSSITGYAMRFHILITGYCGRNTSQSTTNNRSTTNYTNLHAQPMNHQVANASYGTNLPTNGTFNSTVNQYDSRNFHNSSALAQNHTTSSEHPWWKFW